MPRMSDLPSPIDARTRARTTARLMLALERAILDQEHQQIINDLAGEAPATSLQGTPIYVTDELGEITYDKDNVPVRQTYAGHVAALRRRYNTLADTCDPELLKDELDKLAVRVQTGERHSDGGE